MRKMIFGVGLMFVIVFSILFYWIFYTAFTNQSKTTIVDINSIGESKSELYLLLFSIPFVAYFLFASLNIYSSKEKWKEAK